MYHLDELGLAQKEYLDAMRYSIDNISLSQKKTFWDPDKHLQSNLIIEAWDANIDIQCVSNFYACAVYIAT